MMESNIKLGKISGIEIGVNSSWFIIFFLITFFLYGSFTQEHKGWPEYVHLAAALAASALFFLSLLAHEMSHSLLAISRGLPVRSITLFVFGGVSRMEKEAMTAGTEFVVAFKGVHARDVMSASTMAVTAATTLADFFENDILKTGRRCFIVEEEGRLMGIITPHELKAVPRSEWPATTVGQAMRPFDTMKWVDPNADLTRVLELMERNDVNQVPVVSDGHLEGLVRREDIVRFIKTRAEFG